MPDQLDRQEEQTPRHGNLLGGSSMPAGCRDPGGYRFVCLVLPPGTGAALDARRGACWHGGGGWGQKMGASSASPSPELNMRSVRFWQALPCSSTAAHGLAADLCWLWSLL